MGCSVISVESLIVLILTSIFANMKAISGTSSTIQNKENKTISTISQTNVVTREPVSGVTDGNFMDTNYTKPTPHVPNIDTSFLQTLNCSVSGINVEGENCSNNITKLSNKSIVTYRDFKEYTYYKTLSNVVPYAANIPGMITNLLTIIVAAKIKPRHTCEMFMITLGVADFSTVVTRCTYQLWSANSDTSQAGCTVPQYIGHVSLIYSNMILMSWTIERFIAVVFPMKLATWCSVRNTKITLVLLLLLCLLLGIPYLTEFGVRNYWAGKVTVSVCFPTAFVTGVWTHTESLYYIYIPVVCICTCNIAILFRLSTMTKARIHIASNQDTIDRKASENRKMTILLLSISVCFIVLHIPYAIILVFHYVYPDPSILMSEDPHFFAQFLFYSGIGFIITEYQNSVNFFFYCISGSKFRTTFRKVFCKVFIQKKTAHASLSDGTRSSKF